MLSNLAVRGRVRIPRRTPAMPRIRVPRPFAAIAVASAVACGTDPIVLCACSMPAPHTIVHGRVTAPSGQGVQGATVHLDMGPTDCQGMGGTVPAPTDAEGRYATAVLPTGNYAEQCIRLWALAPAGSGLRNSDTVQFTIPTPRTTTGADSVRRDIALRAP